MSFPDQFQLFLSLTTRYFAAPEVSAEWVLIVVLCLLASFATKLPLTAVSRGFRQVARRRRLAIAASFVLPVVLRLSLLGIMPVPTPSIHDEFSHLLLADTLAHGRLTNPTHPLWKYFETIHEIQEPTYASMYPPAQGAFLALGQVVFGHPWAGVVISVALMCALLCWMLQAWMPPAWALFGTVIVILKLCLTGLWMNSYLGGAPSAIGSALVLGSVGRGGAPLAFGFGLVMLMQSRPFEGALLGLAAAVYAWRRGMLDRRFLLRAGTLVAAGCAFTSYYNFRVTGQPLRFAYMLNRDTYGWPENLGFLPPKSLAPLQTPSMEAMRQRELRNREIYRSPQQFLENLNLKLFENWTYFLGPLLTLPLLFLRRRRRTRALLGFLAVLGFITLFQMVLYPYHLGPAVPLVFAAVTVGVRAGYVQLKRVRRNTAYTYAVLLPLGLVAVAAAKEFAPELRLPLAYWEAAREPHGDARAQLESWLSQRPGQQLVVVRYLPSHDPAQEWIYNRADLDHSKIVWARELEDNSRLLDYFHNRSAWLLKADEFPWRILPYRPKQ